MTRARLKHEDTGRHAHVEMGEWDGERFELEGDCPVVKLSDGSLAILLEDLDIADLPEDSRSKDIQKLRSKP